MLQDTLILKTHLQNTSIMRWSDVESLAKGKKPALPVEIVPTKVITKKNKTYSKLLTTAFI